MRAAGTERGQGGRWRSAAGGALCGLAFVVAELAAAARWPRPLDLAAEPYEIAAVAIVLVGGGAAAAASGGRWPRALALLLLGLVLGPELCRTGGAPGQALSLGILGGAALAALAWAPGPVVGLCLALLGGAGPALRARAAPRWAPEQGRPAQPALLITVDTVREDDGLLDDPGFGPEAGVWRYAEAVSAAPWTLPAVLSLLIGEPVRRHGGGLVVEGGHSLPAAERWGLGRRRAGSLALLSNPYLRAGIGIERRFAQIEHTDDGRVPLLLAHNLRGLRARWGGGPSPSSHEPDARIEAAATAALRGGAPFVWVHLIGPHEHRRPCLGRLDVRDCTPEAVRARHAALVEEARARALRLLAVDPERLAVVVADHGEAFGEGGHQGHGLALQDAELRVPLAVRVPGAFGGLVRAPVATTSVIGLLEATLDGAPLPTGAPLPLAPGGKVEVAGLRRGPDAAAERTVGGRYQPLPAAAPAVDRWAPDGATAAALEALGYRPRDDGPTVGDAESAPD
ncbi:MAG: hypothetical protein JNM72_24000 [Deltaproteobacteria bacterium]|nr:hypothetical protein [Deltaproteobacteria bacterium]